jgi:membrane-bound serine protease (ClpP class)
MIQMRSPWRAIAAILGVVAVLGGALFPAARPLGAAQPTERPGPPVVRIPVSGTIELGLAPFVERSLKEAEAAGARAVVLEIETPGGRVDAAQRIVNAIREARVPVYALVNRRAYSAGALIALAAERIYMVPGAVIGAATPVDGAGKKASEKMVSAMRSEMRALAELHHLDPRIAEAMVDEEVGAPGLVEAGKLLTLTTEEAVRVGYAAEVADWPALVSALELDGAPVVEAATNWAEAVVRFLTHPLVAPLLLSLGFLGVLIEFKMPHFGLAGITGVLALALFFGSHYLLGLAGWEAFLALGVGIALLGIEIFLVPGFGFFGISGILAVLAGIYLSLAGKLATAADYARAASSLSVTILVVLVTGWALLRRLPRSRRFARSGILLGEEMSREQGYLSAAVRDDLLGVLGVALTDLRPAGTGQFGDERLDVTADGNWIAVGTPIRIVRAEGYRHVVRAEG